MLTPKGSASNPTNRPIREERKMKADLAVVPLQRAAVQKKVEELMLQKKVQVDDLPVVEESRSNVSGLWFLVYGCLGRIDIK